MKNTTRETIVESFTKDISKTKRKVNSLRKLIAECASLDEKIKLKTEMTKFESRLRNQRLSIFAAEDAIDNSIRSSDAELFDSMKENYPMAAKLLIVLISDKKKELLDGDFVLARNGLNPQIKFAIGLVEGHAYTASGNVQLRLVHVQRRWGFDGHNRPDEKMIQSIYSGLGYYAGFQRDDVFKIQPEEIAKILLMKESEVSILFA